MKSLIAQLSLILSFGIVLVLATLAETSQAALNAKEPTTCNTEEFARLEADFKQMVEIRAKHPGIFSEEEFKAAALAYIASAENCFNATIQTHIRGDSEPAIIDEGGLSPYPELGPLFNTGGLKWGANSPFAGGQNVPGPGTPGGTVTYSYMPGGVSHATEGPGRGNNVNISNLNGFQSCFFNEIATAFTAWSAVSNIQFVEVADSGVASNTPGALGNIRIGGHIFDGSSNILAHAFFPPFTGDTFNSIAGDLHFDIAETWSCTPSSGIDIGLVALHEIGHSIGLDHEPSSGNLAVMNPSYNPALIGLQQDDINGAVSVYGTGAGIPPAPCIPIFSDDHEDGPAGWTVINGAGANSWLHKTDGQGFNGSDNYWFVADINNVSDSYLTSPSINATQPDLTLNFFHSYNLETGFDGGVVEISINGGAFNDVGSANFTKNGYNQTISAVDGSPIAGRPAFSGIGGVYIESVVNLGSLVSQGDSFQIRFREANDPSVAAEGWRVDDVKICNVLRTYLPLILK